MGFSTPSVRVYSYFQISFNRESCFHFYFPWNAFLKSWDFKLQTSWILRNICILYGKSLKLNFSDFQQHFISTFIRWGILSCFSNCEKVPILDRGLWNPCTRPPALGSNNIFQYMIESRNSRARFFLMDFVPDPQNARARIFSKMDWVLVQNWKFLAVWKTRQYDNLIVMGDQKVCV